MKKIVAGILAHVDAGKTTLSEQLLYKSGAIRTAGRVDNGDTFLDTYHLERERGITIFSKQAIIRYGDMSMTLLDTPGHVDFSAEMERTLSVLDYAILLVSAPEGIQAHTKTLWRLLVRYHIPVFIFVNKMDMSTSDRDKVLHGLKESLSENCIDFSGMHILDENSVECDLSQPYQAALKKIFFPDDVADEIALCDEKIMSEYLLSGEVTTEAVQAAIADRKIFPCFYGSALKQEGITQFLNAFTFLTVQKNDRGKFGAVVYKISRDEKNNRLTHMKITGGKLAVRSSIPEYEGKVNQIRLYSGSRFETVQEAEAGEVCAVTGFVNSKAGEVLGEGSGKQVPLFEPLMTYRLIFQENVNLSEAFDKVSALCEELPELHVEYEEETGSISMKIMGEVQLEILKTILKERFGYEVELGAGHIVYKETINNSVYGVGHFEPLRHYAEVHVLLEPGERGSGVVVTSEMREEELAKNWQKLIIANLEEKVHLGVLTGSPVTDIKITLKAGKAHLKHTEGGDFRQAALRAVRQGLMQAEQVLLEPYYDFELTIPTEMTGRTMTDLQQMKAHFQMPDNVALNTIIKGYAPVSLMQDYTMKLRSYTRGQGKLLCTFRGYEPCHNPEEVIEKIHYDVNGDVENTPDSVFCAHGAGYIVPWYEAAQHMHIERKDNKQEAENDEQLMERIKARALNSVEDKRSGYEKDKELEEIFLRTFGSKNQNTDKKKVKIFQSTSAGKSKPYGYKPALKKEKYLLVDGYNVIHAWSELSSLADSNMASARDKLLDILSNYQGYVRVNLIVVFDAYKVKGFEGEQSRYHNIHVVYTKEAETADAYIERFAHEHGKKYDITVATSDGLEQIIIIGQGCHLMSAREFEREIVRVNELIRENLMNSRKNIHEKIVIEGDISKDE